MSESFYIRRFNTVIMIVVIYAAAWMSHFFAFHQVPQQTILPIYHILQHQFYVKRYSVFSIFHETTSFSTKKVCNNWTQTVYFCRAGCLCSLVQFSTVVPQSKTRRARNDKKGYTYIKLDTVVSLKNSCVTSENIHSLQTLFFSHPLDWRRRSWDGKKE